MDKINSKDYYVYILKCSDSTYYTGVTNNLERRIEEHKHGYNFSCYTHRRRPVELVFSQKFYSIEEAIPCEKRYKKWSQKKKEALINGEFDRLPDLARSSSSRHNCTVDSISGSRQARTDMTKKVNL